MSQGKYEDLSGKRFGKLLVIERAGGAKTQFINYICQCDCGNKKVISSAHLRTGATTSCGKRGCRKHINSGVASFNNLYNQYKSQAKYKGREFLLTKDQFRDITSSNCYYCNREPIQRANKADRYVGDYLYNGIDRIDSSGGYTLDNIVPCCKVCNKMKTDMTIDEFYNHMKRILLFRNIL